MRAIILPLSSIVTTYVNTSITGKRTQNPVQNHLRFFNLVHSAAHSPHTGFFLPSFLKNTPALHHFLLSFFFFKLCLLTFVLQIKGTFCMRLFHCMQQYLCNWNDDCWAIETNSFLNNLDSNYAPFRYCCQGLVHRKQTLAQQMCELSKRLMLHLWENSGSYTFTQDSSFVYYSWRVFSNHTCCIQQLIWIDSLIE